MTRIGAQSVRRAQRAAEEPHAFPTQVANPAAVPFAFAVQQEIATFLASDGATTIDPDGAAPFFETSTSMVPEDLAFIT